MDEIPQTAVLGSDLEIILAALNSAYYQNVTLDMLDQYRKLSGREQPSAMTKALQGAIAKVENYIAIMLEDDQEESDSDE
jgi:hypothetical protein